MENDRLAAFSDGVIAVIITIMVLELKIPHGASFSALLASAPIFVSYILSFVYVAIYWNNHHHFFHLVPRVTGAILWANLHLLFWLSLVPFSTAWLGVDYGATAPTVLYGAILFMAALAWYILQTTIIHAQGQDSALSKAVGPDIKGKISPILYLAGILLAFMNIALADALYAIVAIFWLIPDRRVERLVRHT